MVKVAHINIIREGNLRIKQRRFHLTNGRETEDGSRACPHPLDPNRAFRPARPRGSSPLTDTPSIIPSATSSNGAQGFFRTLRTKGYLEVVAHTTIPLAGGVGKHLRATSHPQGWSLSGRSISPACDPLSLSSSTKDSPIRVTSTGGTRGCVTVRCGDSSWPNPRIAGMMRPGWQAATRTGKELVTLCKSSGTAREDEMGVAI